MFTENQDDGSLEARHGIRAILTRERVTQEGQHFLRSDGGSIVWGRRIFLGKMVTCIRPHLPTKQLHVVVAPATRLVLFCGQVGLDVRKINFLSVRVIKKMNSPGTGTLCLKLSSDFARLHDGLPSSCRRRR